MKRDLDLIREILLGIEDDPKFDGRAQVHQDRVFSVPNRTPAEVSYHLRLLILDGYVVGQEADSRGTHVVFGMTMKGHDYLDSVRDPEIWSKTKEGAKLAGGFTLSLLGDLAKGFLKTKIKEQTGIDL